MRTVDDDRLALRPISEQASDRTDGRWLEQLPLEYLGRSEAVQYRSAAPFPHIVLDDLFPAEVLLGVLDEFPGPDDIDWMRFQRGHERKLASVGDHAFGPRTRAFLAELNSSRFVTFLEDLTGIRGLIPDPHFEGGGLHQIERGGYLNVHVDFNHHRRLKLHRRLNLIVYLNQDWHEDWGGHIEFWNRDVTRCERRLLPVFNRTVIFSTTERSWHGHPMPLNCPEGRTRKSIALYYYSSSRPRDEIALGHSTNFRFRPGDAIRLTHDVILSKLLPPVVIDIARLFRDRFAGMPRRSTKPK